MSTFFINLNLRNSANVIPRIQLWGSNIKADLDFFIAMNPKLSYIANNREFPKLEEKLKQVPAEILLFPELGHYEWKQKLKPENLWRFVLPEIITAYLNAGYQLVSSTRDSDEALFVFFKPAIVVVQQQVYLQQPQPPQQPYNPQYIPQQNLYPPAPQ